MSNSRFEVALEEETGLYSLIDRETRTKEGHMLAIPEWANFQSYTKKEVQNFADKLNRGEARLMDEDEREALRFINDKP